MRQIIRNSRFGAVRRSRRENSALFSDKLSDPVTSSNGQFAIDLQRVEKIYRGKVHALRGIEMRVHRGEIFGLLGPNGAGKSTLVKIMMTVVRATSVQGSLLGNPVGHKPTLAKVGYLPEHHRMPQYLTGKQVLQFYAALAKVKAATRKKRSEELLDRRHGRLGQQENLVLFQGHAAAHRAGPGADERPGPDCAR